jgi:hypothetical protein
MDTEAQIEVARFLDRAPDDQALERWDVPVLPESVRTA